MNQIIKYCVCWCMSMSAFCWCEAQNISRIEYYIDNDPGYGKATSVPFAAGTNVANIALNINPNSFSPGVHILCLRAKDASGKWSYEHKWAFAKSPPADVVGAAPKINKVEYYLDNTADYGAGIPVTITSATNLQNKTISLSFSSLPPGVHWINVRALDANGKWSYDNRWLFVRPFSTDTASAGATPKISAVEYYLDNDPGYGVATPLTINSSTNLSDLLINLNPSTLMDGVHILCARAKTVTGIWGYGNRWLFVKAPVASLPDTVTSKLSKVEYYIDNDPGYGNATPLAITTAYNLPDYYLSTNISGLAAGDHKLYVRSINAGGKWSYDNIYSFRIVSEVTGASVVISNISPRTLCNGGTIKVSYQATGTYNAGNKFIVQLSDATGSFASPTALGNSIATSDVINCSVPAGLASGNLYRIRVVSNNPVVTGDAYNVNAGTGLDASFNGYANYLVMSFQNTSVYASSYAWNFGDSITSYEQNPQHTYARAGDYNVCLIATNACNQKRDTTCKVISIDGVSFTDDDRDGLFDLSENFYGSVIGNFDTNNDGLADGINVFTGTALLSADADNDGISNTQELLLGTSPVLKDTDFDGVPDNLDAYPLDRNRSKIPPANGADVTAPVITVNL